MGYKVSLQRKEERKKGYDAVLELSADAVWDAPKVLALAKANLKYFEEWDEYSDADFCQQMEWLRKNNYDLYRVFWWWRKALEDHAKKGDEEDGFQIKETKYRCFMITQFLAKPWSDDWEPDRKTLKPGVVPLITEDKIKEALDRKGIKRWAYILHDKDVYTEEDEIADLIGRIKAGEQKFSHLHVILDMPSKNTLSAVCRWFDVPPNMVEIIKGRSAFLDALEYLPHESPKAVEQKKTRYSRDKIEAFGVDVERELNDLQSNRAKFGKRAGEMTPADTMMMHVMVDGWTMRQCRKNDPMTYAKVRGKLPGLRLDYLKDAEPCPMRINIYVDGDAGVGKSTFCEYLAEALFPAEEYPFFAVGNDSRVTFEGYDGEPCIIWDDYRASTFITQFKPNGTYRILDTHPKKQAQQIKGSSIILTNPVNIINGVDPYNKFISELAIAYKDADGVMHDAEDENQAWRRFPIILCVREGDFDILLNQGFMNRDIRSYKTMIMYANVSASMRKIAHNLDGTAKKVIVDAVTKPVIEAFSKAKEAETDKISDVRAIPDEFKHFGEVKYANQLEREKEVEKWKKEEKAILIAQQEHVEETLFRWQKGLEEKMVRDHLLHLFGEWFWLVDVKYAPFCSKFTFAGACVLDRSLYVTDDLTQEEVNEVIGRQYKFFTKGVSDEALKYLATIFNNSIQYPLQYGTTNNFLLNCTPTELRQSIEDAWMGADRFEVEYALDDDDVYHIGDVKGVDYFRVTEFDVELMKKASVFVPRSGEKVEPYGFPDWWIEKEDSISEEKTSVQVDQIPFSFEKFLEEQDALALQYNETGED